MATNRQSIDSIASADRSSKATMMEMWREKNQQIRQERQAPIEVAKDEDDSRSELEQKIRNGEIPCPTCINRKYMDDSSDSGVSMQTPTTLSPATAGLSVLSHEQEHVNRNRSDAADEKERMTFERSTVSIMYDTCPECGRQYVCGGVTTTTTQGLHGKMHTANAEEQKEKAREDAQASLTAGSVDLEA